MPEFNVIHITVIALLTVVGAIVGWILRGQRGAEEKAVVNAGWQEQINAQRTEHDRLTEQNKALMEQVSQYLASNKDAKNRAKELSEAVQEANQRRDQLQREIKDIRSTLETSLSERDQLQSDISSQAAEARDAETKDARIEKLQRSLESWQDRLPPLIEKFRQRNEEANQFESDLVVARARIIELEGMLDSNQTLIESIRDPEELTDGRAASNDAIDDGEPDIATDDENAGEEDQDDDSVDLINDVRDDLKAIKGIGPAIEKTLNELGIFRYQQIADMSEYDIDRVAKHLQGFRSRIYREDWIGQARDLGDPHPSD